jgi:hypothetical protein
MKRFILLLNILLLTSLFVSAQNGIPYIYSSHFNQQASRFHPSLLGDTPYSGQVNIASLYGWVGTNAVTYGNIRSVIDKSLSNSQVDAIVAGLRDRNHISVGAYVPAPFVNFAFKSQKEDETGKKTERFSLSLFSGARTEANFTFDKVLAEFAWKGNKQFVGRSVDVGKVSANGFGIAEAGAGLAIPFTLNEKITIRGGIRLKYIWGFASVYTEKASGVLTTIDNGTDSEVKAELDYKANIAGFPDDPSNYTVSGKGFGIDWGGTVIINQRFVATLSMIDLGRVKYQNYAKNYTLNGTTSFKGIDLNASSGESNLIDSLVNQFASKESAASYNSPLPARVILQGEYRIPAETKKGEIYNKHTFYLTYFQGLRNFGAATTNPALSAGYSLNLGKIMNVGTSLGIGGQNRFALGFFTSFRLGGITIGAGSGNCLYLLSPNSATGVDLALNVGLNF